MNLDDMRFPVSSTADDIFDGLRRMERVDEEIKKLEKRLGDHPLNHEALEAYMDGKISKEAYESVLAENTLVNY